MTIHGPPPSPSSSQTGSTSDPPRSTLPKLQLPVPPVDSNGQEQIFSGFSILLGKYEQESIVSSLSTVCVTWILGVSLSKHSTTLPYFSDRTISHLWYSHVIISASLSKYTEPAENYFSQYLSPWASKHHKKIFKSRNFKALLTAMSKIFITALLFMKSKKHWIFYLWSVWYKSDTGHKLDNTVP